MEERKWEGEGGSEVENKAKKGENKEMKGEVRVKNEGLQGEIETVKGG